MKICIKCTDSLRNVAYLRGEVGGQWYCVLSSGIPAAFSYAGIGNEETAARIELEKCQTADDALDVVKRYGYSSFLYQIFEGPRRQTPEPAEQDEQAAPSHWDENDRFPVFDWKDQVQNGDTRLGYADWLADQIAQHEAEFKDCLQGAVDNLTDALDAVCLEGQSWEDGWPEIDQARTMVLEQMENGGPSDMGSKAKKKPETFTYLEMEAALCTWEWMNDSRCGNETPLPKDTTRSVNIMNEVWEGLGSAGMRDLSIHAGKIVLAVHAHMTAAGFEHNCSYDWEFVPAVLKYIDWPALCAIHQYGAKKPDPHNIETIWKNVADDLGEDIYPATGNDTWTQGARYFAGRIYNNIDMIDGDPEGANKAKESGMSPRDYVMHLGEKYNLVKAG